MRNISAKRRTTPTYIYNISDAQASGIDLDQMNIGMTIVFGDGKSKSEPTVYVLPVDDGNDIFEVPAQDVNSGIVHFVDPSYCQHTAESNSFSITLPLWKLDPSVVSEAVFHVFLYGEIRRTTGGSIINDDGIGVPTISLVSLHNIVIDEGLFTLEESLVPPIVGQSKSLVPPVVGETPSSAPPIVGQSKRSENYVEFV